MFIIGITGTIGAGKGAIVEYLVEKYHFNHLSVRDFLRLKIKEKGYDTFDRDILTKVANELRKTFSPSYLVDELYKQALASGENTIIESIRTLGEIRFLREKGNFILLGVDAHTNIRYERIVKRNSETDRISFDTFLENEQREMRATDPTHQNLSSCLALADYTIENNGDVVQLHRQVDAIMQKIDYRL